MNTEEKISAIENSMTMFLRGQTITAAEGLTIARRVSETMHRLIAECASPESAWKAQEARLNAMHRDDMYWRELVFNLGEMAKESPVSQKTEAEKLAGWARLALKLMPGSWNDVK